MNYELGDYTLAFAMFAALGAMFAGIVAVRVCCDRWLRVARVLAAITIALIIGTSGVLLYALTHSDFRIQYVAHYTERALPIGYKYAAFWAGQEGSLLLWTLLLCAMSGIAIFRQRGEKGSEPAATIATLAAIMCFFAALLLFAANPFKLSEVVPPDGSGLNPLLQDPGMIIHPPLLFIGYAGYAIPFAILVGAMVAGRSDSDWLNRMRSWNLFAWLFLSAGILWGGHWSYHTLGWGGYWAWDPVENASWLPWLTGTALLHSTNIQLQRGNFKRWNASLISVSFILCLFGTYLTRSGVVSSVHSFGENPIGNFFLGAIVVTVLTWGLMLVVRRKELEPASELDNLFGREGAFLSANVLLTLIMAMTLVGTIFPLLSKWTAGREVTVDARYYNHLVVPMGILLVAIMALGPVLTYGKDAATKLTRATLWPGLISGAIAGVVWALGIDNPWALVNSFLISLVVLIVVIELGKAALARSRKLDESYVAALLGLIDSNHRRYGGQTAHVGVAMIVMGIVGSSLFSQKQALQFTPGQTINFAGYNLRFDALKEDRRENYTAVVANLTMTEPSGNTQSLHPSRRFYDKSEDAYSEVAIQSSLREDLYITLAGWEAGGSTTAIQTIVNPLVIWIWIGGFVMAGGTVLCMLPRLLPQVSLARSAVHSEPIAHGRTAPSKPAEVAALRRSR